MGRTSAGRRAGAVLGLVAIVVAVAALASAAVVVVAREVVGTESAAARAYDERADVHVRHCRPGPLGLTATVRVRNKSSAPSSYFVDVAVIRRATGEQVDLLSGTVDVVDPDDTARLVLTSSRRGARLACRIADVDRLYAD